jgi:hypothetical protein
LTSKTRAATPPVRRWRRAFRVLRVRRLVVAGHGCTTDVLIVSACCAVLLVRRIGWRCFTVRAARRAVQGTVDLTRRSGGGLGVLMRCRPLSAGTCSGTRARDVGVSSSATDSGISASERGVSSHPAGRPSPAVKRSASASSMRFFPCSRCAIFDPLRRKTAPSLTFEPFRVLYVKVGLPDALYVPP